MFKKALLVIALCALATAFFGNVAAAKDIDDIDYPKLNKLNIPDVEKVTLDNGIRLYLLEDKSLPIFNVSVRINGGSYLEPAEKIGLADIVGSVMRTGGTEKWTGDEIDAMLEGIGGSVETFADLSSTGAFINVLSEYTGIAVEVLAEVLRRPAFADDKIELAKVQAKSGISRRNDQVGPVARREFTKLIYGADSPYARHTEYATIDAITRDDLVAFHKMIAQPESIQMAIWGDFDKDEVIKLINQHFGDWAKGNVEIPALPEVNYDWRSKVYYVEKKDAKQTYIRIGHIGGLQADADYADRIVMNSILGGGFGSRLMDNVRTRLGLAYSVGGRYISNISYPGYFFAVGSTAPENTMLATNEMLTQIKSMQTDLPTDKEMKKGKDGYLNSFVFNFDSKREVINRMMTYDFYGIPEDFLQKEKEGVENATAEAVMAAANNNLRTDQMIIVIAGNADEFDAPLESLGLPIDTVDITIPSGEKKVELAITPENLEKGMALMNQAADAHGGLDKIKTVESMVQNGTLTLVMGPRELPVQVNSLVVFPDKSRAVMSLMGQTMYEIRDGDVGWKTDQTNMGITEMTAEDIKESDVDMARDYFYMFRKLDEPYFQAVYDGSEEVDGKTIDWVAIVNGTDGESICRLGLDQTNHHVVCKRYWGKSMQGEGMLDVVYSELADISGIQIPMLSVTNMNGQKIRQMATTECSVNGEVPADAFVRPE